MVMRLFGLGAKQEDDEPHINDPEQILAYLEELEGPGVPAVTIQPANNPKVAPILVRVDGVFEQKGACKLVFAQRLPKGLTPKIPLIMYFIVSEMRFRTDPIYYRKTVGGNHIFSLPKKIYHAERRENRRHNMLRRERAQILILENLQQGTGGHRQAAQPVQPGAVPQD